MVIKANIEYYLREIKKEEEIGEERDKELYSLLKDTFDFWEESVAEENSITFWENSADALIRYNRNTSQFTLLDDDTEKIIDSIQRKLGNYLDRTIQENYDKEDVVKTLKGI